MLSYKLGLSCSLQSPIRGRWVCRDDASSRELSQVSQPQLGAETRGGGGGGSALQLGNKFLAFHVQFIYFLLYLC